MDVLLFRSHAIFTITLEQRKLMPPSTGLAPEPSRDDSGDDEEEGSDAEDGMDDSYLCAKMHLVDLAGVLWVLVWRAFGGTAYSMSWNAFGVLVCLTAACQELPAGSGKGWFAFQPTACSPVLRLAQSGWGG